MAWTLDARIPVSFAPTPADGRPAAWLSAAPAPAWPPGTVAGIAFSATPVHPAGCACCNARSRAAEALDRLFQARVRNSCAWFERVLVAPEASEEVRAALRDDPLARARFRLEGAASVPQAGFTT